ncbi:MAG: glutamate 5-kinase [Clostridiaceae bacterium]
MKNVKRIVIKVGSSTLTYKNGLLNLNMMEQLVRQISDMKNRGIEIIFVTSGAIGAGMGKLSLNKRPKTIPEKQATAAVGQGILMHMYEKLFSEYSVTVAQILLTKEDLNHRDRFLNSRNALFCLLSKNVIPIINENDAVAIDEIKFGDNDTLSALVASLTDADLLIVLSDINGLYDKNPSTNTDATLIKEVENITPAIENCAGVAGSNLGTGGMITKIQAAKICVNSGNAMVIVNGSRKGVLGNVLNGNDIGTFFKPLDNHLSSRKKWLAYASDIKGNLIIDEGAKLAIRDKNKSLLPSGIKKIEGCFSKGDVVSILDIDNLEIGRGIINYDYKDISLIKGCKSSCIEEILGHKNYDEIILKDNLVII